MTLHRFNLRMIAEDMVRVRRADDRERYAASQRQARIDPTPHQIDAVIFALRRLHEGGCILADEVGLGKTIEAGLVIAQSRAEGAQRVLLIVPKSAVTCHQALARLARLPSASRSSTSSARAQESWCAPKPVSKA